MMTLYEAAERGKLTVLKSIVRSGKNVNKCNGSGLTALHLAVQHNHVECVSFLLECSKIQPNIQEHQSAWTPLHVAMAYRRLRCAILLLSHVGIDPMIFDKAGRSPFDLLYPSNETALVPTNGGSFYTWGAGSNCALGHGSTDNKAYPKLVRALEGKRVVEISVAQYTIACVTSSGGCYTVGLGVGGRLGHGDEETLLMPQRLAGPLQKKRVSSVSMAHSHGALVTEDGHIYTFGDGEYGKLGHGNKESTSQPKRVRGALEDKAVIAASAGRYHTLALTSRGELFSFGRGDSGQLGYLMAQGKEDMFSQTAPRKVVGLNAPITQVAAGNVHTICCTERHEAFLFGFGSHLLRRVTLLPPSSRAPTLHNLSSFSSSSPPPFSEFSPSSTTPPLSQSPLFASSQNINSRAITVLAANGDASLMVQGQTDVFLLSLDEIFPNNNSNSENQSSLHSSRENVFTSLSSAAACVGGGGKNAAATAATSSSSLSLLHQNASNALVPKKIPATPGGRKAITSAAVDANKDIMITTDKGQLWKYSAQLEGGSCSWKLISYKRFNKIACNRGHYAGLLDDSFSFSINLNPGTIVTDIAAMIDQPEYCDIALVLNSGETVYAHRAILAMRCKYFADKFSMQLSDTKEPNRLFGELPEMKVEDVAHDIFMFMLRYLYTDSFLDPKTGKMPSSSECRTLLAFARKLEIPCDHGSPLHRTLHSVVTQRTESGAVTDSTTVTPKKAQKGGSRKKNESHHYSTFEEDMRMLFDDKLYTDVELVSGDGVSLPCHKFILSARSDVLKAMLSSGMFESRSNVVTLPEVKSFTLQRLKEYLYGIFPYGEFVATTPLAESSSAESLSSSSPLKASSSGGEVKALPSQVIIELCGLGNELMCERLKQICEKMMIPHIDGQNVLNIYLAADAYRAEQLKDACLRYIEKFLPHMLTAGFLGSSLSSAQYQPELLAEIEKKMEEDAKAHNEWPAGKKKKKLLNESNNRVPLAATPSSPNSSEKNEALDECGSEEASSPEDLMLCDSSDGMASSDSWKRGSKALCASSEGTATPNKAGKGSNKKKNKKKTKKGKQQRPPSPTSTSTCTKLSSSFEEEEALFVLDEDIDFVIAAIAESEERQALQQQQQQPQPQHHQQTGKKKKRSNSSNTQQQQQQQQQTPPRETQAPSKQSHVESSIKGGSPIPPSPNETASSPSIAQDPKQQQQQQQQGRRRRNRGKSNLETTTTTTPTTTPTKAAPAWGVNTQKSERSPGTSFLDIQKEQQKSKPPPKSQQQPQQPQQQQQQLRASQEAIPIGHFLEKKEKSASPAKRQQQTTTTTTTNTTPPHTNVGGNKQGTPFKWNVQHGTQTTKPSPPALSFKQIQEQQEQLTGNGGRTRSQTLPTVKKGATQQQAQQPQQPQQPATQGAWGQQQPQQQRTNKSSTGAAAGNRSNLTRSTSGMNAALSSSPSKAAPPPLFPQAPKVSLREIRAEEERKLMEEKKRKEKPVVQPMWLIQMEEEAMAELRRYYGKEHISAEEIEAAYKYK